jgi:hypothetical protein
MEHFRHSLNRVGLPSFYGLALVLASSAASAGTASFPIYVPQECVELAQREGGHIVIENRVQAAKAKYKLYRLKANDPLVRDCRDAVQRAQTARRTAARE